MCCTDVPDTPEFIDRDPPPRVLIVAGIRWSVSEAPNRYDRRLRADLVFDAGALTMRVRHYPAKWRELSDDDLWDLAWSRHEDGSEP